MANVRESKRNGQAGAWLPPAQSPATKVVIPGMPAAPGSRVLYVAVPGTDNAQVKVTAVTSKGSYQPTGGSNIDLPSNSAAQIQLPSLAGVAGAVEVSANVPVTATMMVSGGAAGAPGAIAASAAPVQEQGVIADCPHGAAGSAQLVLSAPGKAGSVRIVTGSSSLTVAGQAGQVVTIPAGHHRAGAAPAQGQQGPRIQRRDHAAGRIWPGLRRARDQVRRVGAVDHGGAEFADLGAAGAGQGLAADRAALT